MCLKAMFSKCVAIAFAALSIQLASAQLTNDKTKLLTWCLNTTLHKDIPSKEDSLHAQCAPWSEKSCCTAETTKNIHEGDMHNFNLNHCYTETGKNLSPKCREFFNQDNCFYECEPHIGLWVVQTNRRIATERFQNVPLCESQCRSWWEACKDDLTCAYNWPRNFRFKNGVNSCPGKCQSFKSIYKGALDFCETVWDHSWKVTPDTSPCMKMWFDNSSNNPNEDVAKFYIDQRFNAAPETISRSSVYLLLCTTLFLVIGI